MMPVAQRRSRTQELQTLAEIALTLASAVNIEEVYPRFVETLTLLLPTDRVSVSRLSEGGDGLTVEYVHGVPSISPLGTTFPERGSAAGYVLRTGRSLVIGDLATQRRFPHLQGFAEDGMRSAAFLPLIAGEEQVGVLSVMSRQPWAYRRAHLHLLKDVSALLAHAVRNTRLFSQVQELAQAVSASGEAIAVTDKDCVITFANPAFERLLGYASNELVGQSIATLYPNGWSNPTLVEAHAELMRSGSWTGTGDLVGRGGEIVATRETATCLYDSAGEVAGFVCVNADDRFYRQAEELLRRREELYRAITENLGEGVSISVDNAQVLVNSTFLQLVGLESESDAIGTPIESFLSDGLPPGTFANRLASSDETNHTHKIGMPDGSVRILRYNIREIPYRGQRGLLVVVQDDTHNHFRAIEQQTVLKCAEVFVGTSSFEDRALAATSIITDAFNFQQGTLALSDEQGVLHLLNTRRTSPGAPGWLPTIGTGITRRAFTSGQELVTHDYPNEPNARPEIIALGVKSLGAFPLLIAGKSVGVLTLSTEVPGFFNGQILESIRAVATQVGYLLQNALLQERVREEHSLKERADTFVSIASHELRTPLTLTLGYSELLLRRDLPDAVKEDALQRIHQGSARVVSIINDMLDVSRLHTGNIKVECQWLPLQPTVEEAINSVRPLAKMHTLVNDVPSELSAVWADRDKVIQIMTNLLENAVKYSPDGGEIRVSGTENKANSTVVIGVSDQGVGISPEDQTRLFDSFSRIKRATDEIGGVGLGLYICRSLLHLMNGSIWVESEVDKGSTFYVGLPTYAAGTLPSPQPPTK